MAEPTGETKRLDIRKYPNRRYYDTTRSRHVTLEEIYALIRSGYDVQITDSKTGDDITTKVLAQIIIELDPPKLGVFPVPLLHRLLRSNEQLMTDFVHKYFNEPLTAFLDSQRNFEQYLRQAMGLQSATPTIADWTKMMWGPFNPGLWRTPPQPTPGAVPNAAPPTPSAAGRTQAETEELRNMVDRLRAEVERLQDQLAEEPSPPSRRKDSRSKRVGDATATNKGSVGNSREKAED